MCGAGSKRGGPGAAGRRRAAGAPARRLAAALALAVAAGAARAEPAPAPAAPRFTQIHLADGRAPAQAPRRIVSINMCADELALRLARPGALVSVTPLSRDYMGSNVAELARRVPANRGAAEEIAALEPDLVIAGRYTTRLVKALLRRLGFTVAEFDVPGSIREARDQIREAGALFHNHAAAEAIAARFDRLLAAPAPSGPRPTAIVLRPAGFTSSEGSLLDDMLTRAGMTNLAGGPLAGYEQLPLEFVLAAQPDILVIAGDPDQPPSMASEILSHPALRRLAERAGVVTLPSRLWTCPGPGVLDAMALLQEAVARWRGRAAVAAAAPALTAPAAAERTGGGP